MLKQQEACATEAAKKKEKREREKQRRAAVRNAYDELSDLLDKVDCSRQGLTHHHDSLSSGCSSTTNTTHVDRTRIQLVQDAMVLIRTLENENKQLRSFATAQYGGGFEKVRMGDQALGRNVVPQLLVSHSTCPLRSTKPERRPQQLKVGGAILFSM